MLGARQVEELNDDREVPHWRPVVCRCRGGFVACSLLMGEGEAQRTFLFLYAMQSPYTVARMELNKVTTLLPARKPSSIQTHGFPPGFLRA